MEAESSGSPESLAIAVIGTDTVIEALPARPIQLANACGELGFDLAVPLSWGDELVAEAAIVALQSRGNRPAVLCTCPLARRRLLASGTDLRESMVSLLSPPIALARHLRATLGARLTSLTFVGRCPDAVTPDYDSSLQPDDFLRLARARGIDLQKLPDTFFDRLPADRRRFVSLPGGTPTPEVLWQRCNERILVELEGTDFALGLGEHLLSAKPVLVDVSASVGCSCSGATPSTKGYPARVVATSLEPPRSSTPVIGDALVSLEYPVNEATTNHVGVRPESNSPARRTPMAVTPTNALGAR